MSLIIGRKGAGQKALQKLTPTLFFEGTDGPIESGEFIEFLDLFRDTYNQCLDIVGKRAPEQVERDASLLMKKMSRHSSEIKLKFGHYVNPSEYAFQEYQALHVKKRSLRKSMPKKITFSSIDDPEITGVIEELRFIRIEKASPLRIDCTCVVSALVLAVIISGGKVDLAVLKFTIKPLGEGIKSLRAALSAQKKVQTPVKRQTKQEVQVVKVKRKT
jgi:hypothetical protein